ncbi:MAG TPA: hypothetical protein VK714_14770 [Myxococcota bacterium]|nr:hypothetical protein [Myxococcota bacterium]
MGGLRSLSLAVLFGLAFLATTASIRTALPWPRGGAFDARMRHFISHVDEYDLVFVGSSSVARGFDPAVFDAALAARGHPLRSFNLGVDGMWSLEADYLIREIVRRQPTRLRWIVIDLFELDPKLDSTPESESDVFTERGFYWHDAWGLAQVLRRVFAGSGGLREEARLAWVHVRLAAWRLGNLGQGDIALASWWAGPASEDAGIVQGGGFEALDDLNHPVAGKMRAFYLANAAQYEGVIATLDERNARPEAPPEAKRAEIREQSERLRAANIEPLYIIPPILRATPSLYGLVKATDVPVLGFNSPTRYPELYATEHRWDATHLNRAGAQCLSRLLAERLADLLDREGRTDAVH